MSPLGEETADAMKVLGPAIMSEPNECKSCRFNPNNNDYAAGGDCSGCKDGSSWRELKRVNETRCKTCLYCDDPCHYICVECQDAKNWTPRPTLEEEVLQAIEKQKAKLRSLEFLLLEVQEKQAKLRESDISRTNVTSGVKPK